jgi:hypothetical protein
MSYEGRDPVEIYTHDECENVLKFYQMLWSSD